MSSEGLVDVESTFLDLEAGLRLSYSAYNLLKQHSRCDIDFYPEGINSDREKKGTFNGQSTNSLMHWTGLPRTQSQQTKSRVEFKSCLVEISGKYFL